MGSARDSIITIYGTVLSQDSSRYLPNTHVINKRSYQGTITNGIGEYLIQGKIGDTLVFSNVSYQFYYHKISGNEPVNLIVKLKTRNYLLDEVSVNAYKLTSNDPKPMVVGKPMIPRNEDIYTPHSLKPTLANPVDLLYYLFSKRPKELEHLRQLYAEDFYREKLKQGNNREVLVTLTGVPREELEAFMFYCKYADTYISTLNDYDFLISLLNCYDQYQRERAVNKLIEEQGVREKINAESERFTD
jgi:hypothetical protein